jgi:2-amino-4-hydroxy-6-hydroxymethyldihydropteridine diphosphokinase
MIVIALGANLPSSVGAPRNTLAAALGRLSAQGIRIANVSSYYVTKAWPDPADPAFVNAVARVETKHAPRELMAILHGIEEYFGRTRGKRNAPRTLDIDLIDYDGRVELGPPKLPHPRLSDRVFVLVPLAEIVPDWKHPATGHSIEALIGALPDDARAIEKLGT